MHTYTHGHTHIPMHPPGRTGFVVELFDLAQLSDAALGGVAPGEGIDSADELFKYLASLDGETVYDVLSNITTDPDFKPFCIGSSVAPGHVLTAAQCVALRASNPILARGGAYHSEEVDERPEFRFAVGIKVHPDYPLQPGVSDDIVESYTEKGYTVRTDDASGGEGGDVADVMSSYDLALIKLQEPFDAPLAVDLATLEDMQAHNATVGQRPFFVLGRQMAGKPTAPGWGDVTWQTLFEGMPEECPSAMARYNEKHTVKFSSREQPTDMHLCALNNEFEDGCQADRGSPATITVDDYSSALAGIVVLGCSGYNQPAFFVDVIEHSLWIRETVSNPDAYNVTNAAEESWNYMENYAG